MFTLSAAKFGISYKGVGVSYKWPTHEYFDKQKDMSHPLFLDFFFVWGGGGGGGGSQILEKICPEKELHEGQYSSLFWGGGDGAHKSQR